MMESRWDSRGRRINTLSRNGVESYCRPVGAFGFLIVVLQGLTPLAIGGRRVAAECNCIMLAGDPGRNGRAILKLTCSVENLVQLAKPLACPGA
jgi:hypothetical protein